MTSRFVKMPLIGGLSLGFLIIATQVQVATPQQPGSWTKPQTDALLLCANVGCVRTNRTNATDMPTQSFLMIYSLAKSREKNFMTATEPGCCAVIIRKTAVELS